MFLSFRCTIFGLFLSEFCFFLPHHLCGISFARCRSSDLPFVCWILFFLVSSTPYNPRSRCSSLVKLAAEQESFCFALLSFCLCSGGWRWLWWTCFISCCFDAVFVTSMLGSLNTWQRVWSSSLEQNQALLVSSLLQLAPLAVHKHTRKNTYHRS